MSSCDSFACFPCEAIALFITRVLKGEFDSATFLYLFVSVFFLCDCCFHFHILWKPASDLRWLPSLHSIFTWCWTAWNRAEVFQMVGLNLIWWRSAGLLLRDWNRRVEHLKSVIQTDRPSRDKLCDLPFQSLKQTIKKDLDSALHIY